MLLNRAGIVTRPQLIGMRRYMIVLAFAAAAVLTPPDVVSQLMLAIPLVLLFEMTLVVIWFTERKERTAAREDIKRAEERRVGKEWVSTGRYWWRPSQ